MHAYIRLKYDAVHSLCMPDIDLSPTDRAILEMLNEGRCTPAYIAAERDYSRAHVRNRLQRLTEHGQVRRLHKGLYELVEEPQDE